MKSVQTARCMLRCGVPPAVPVNGKPYAIDMRAINRWLGLQFHTERYLRQHGQRHTNEARGG